jgi:hypothetical protein
MRARRIPLGFHTQEDHAHVASVAGFFERVNADHVLYPGNQSITTFLSTMLDGSTAISYPQAGSAGIEGNGSITFFDENCANTGGC